ncbi:inner membrane CreD family protein [Oleiharenicola lentus]|uniref:inner membrane CreD family protein n=1 Tax=Oleiharenicola lentus TaxID=2508720 RepID=UPI003F67EF0A
METAAQPPLLQTNTPRRRNTVTLKLLFIAALVLVLHVPLKLINDLRQERSANREEVHTRLVAERTAVDVAADTPAVRAAEGYRMTERSLKHGALVLTLVFTTFFLFETLAGLRLHAVHYALVGAALCLFYLALLALGEVMLPGLAYIAAAGASSLLIVCYSITILRSALRATSIAALLASVHAVLYVVLRMEDYALLAGTTALFVVLAAVMFFTRNVDWFSQEAGKEAKT